LNLLRCFGNGGDDIGVTRAATDIAGEAVTDLALRARTPAQDQIARSDQHTGRAIAALQRVGLVKIAAQHSRYSIAREALDRLDLTLVAGDGEYQARARRLAVDEDRAGAADAVLAAEMRAGEIAALAQKIRERQSRRHVICYCCTIDPKSDRCHCSA